MRNRLPLVAGMMMILMGVGARAQPIPRIVTDEGIRIAPSSGVPAEPMTVPVVSFRSRVKATAAKGEDLVYKFEIHNRSRASAHHVEVRNPIPEHATFVSATPKPSEERGEIVWELGTLKSCERREIELVLRPTGGGDVVNCARIHYAHGQCTTTRVAGPRLSVRKTGPSEATLYQSADYRIEVRNDGATTLEEVVLTDDLPAGMTVESDSPNPKPDRKPESEKDKKTLLIWNLGELRAGERRTFSYRALLLKKGTFTNRAQVTAKGGVREQSSSTVTVGEARLKISLDGPEQRYVDQSAVCEIKVVNEGEAVARDVEVRYQVPKGARIEGISDSGRMTEDEIIWNLARLAPGDSESVRVEVRAEEAGEMTHQGTARIGMGPERTASTRTTFKGFAGFSLDISDRDQIQVGETERYRIRVRNTGTAKANEVRVKATLPPELESVSPSGPSKGSVKGREVAFEPITLSPREEVIYEISAKAVKPGDVRVKVELSAKELEGGPVTQEESTRIFRP